MSQPIEKPPEQRTPFLLTGGIFILLGIGLLVLSRFYQKLPAFMAHMAYILAASLLVAAAGLVSTALLILAQRRGPQERKSFHRRGARPLHPLLEKARRNFDAARTTLANVDWRGDWLPISSTLLLCGLATYALAKGWTMPAARPSANFDAMAGGVLAVMAFPLLVVERYFFALPLRVAPDAKLLSRLCRIPILALMGLAAACGVRWLGLSWAVIIEHGVAVIIGLVTLELTLRSLVYFFAPLPALAERRSHAQSSLAGMIQLGLPDFGKFNETVSHQFGIDLGRSWAIAFIRRAALPVAGAMLLAGWLMTGITALGTNERAIYEAFGRPQGVLHPGLHVLLPWPFGVLKQVDYGAVREIPIVFAAEDGTPPEMSETSLPNGTIEGPPPPAADRLWDSSHPSEASYLVANFANGRQGFEVVNIDLRIAYRIGLSDQAARDATYNIAEPEAVIRSATGQMLARYFARYTITDVLGQNREAFIRAFQKELQSRLTALATGVDILAVVVEAIHPPADAAGAYQNVQAAAIRATTAISSAAAAATSTMKEAQMSATQARDLALAEAAERVDQAKADSRLFTGDHDAYAAGGASFLFERRIDRLSKGLTGKPLIIIDHRIPHDQAPWLDMRGQQGAPAFVPPPPTGDEED